MPSLIAANLKQRHAVADSEFDALLGPAARERSKSYWSVVRAAQLAADLFREAGAERVLDVGSGVGKAAAILSLDLGRRVWGVEQRPHLVLESRKLAQALGAEVVVLEGGLEQINPHRFDGFYCFNPFAENVADPPDCFDLTTERSFDRYLRDARRVESWLREAPLGTALVTLNGLGGRVPVSFTVRRALDVNGDTLRLWVKDKVVSSDEAWIELEGNLVLASRIAALAEKANGFFSDTSLVRALALPGR
ncbi:MAG: class I SAM-dependent methyltransferase [Myxococcaceae bacterium]